MSAEAETIREALNNLAVLDRFVDIYWAKEASTRMTQHERDYLKRTIETVRNHRNADNCWPSWANIFADEIERLWLREAELEARIAARGPHLPTCAYIVTSGAIVCDCAVLSGLPAEDVEEANLHP